MSQFSAHPQFFMYICHLFLNSFHFSRNCIPAFPIFVLFNLDFSCQMFFVLSCSLSLALSLYDTDILIHKFFKMNIISPAFSFTLSLFSQIPAEHFSKDPNIKQYVHLQGEFGTQTLEKTVLISLQYGYIFIQTDKTIYTPSTTGESFTPLLMRNTNQHQHKIIWSSLLDRT